MKLLTAIFFALLLGAPAYAAIKAEIPPLKPPREELPRQLDQYDPLPWFIAAAATGVLTAALAWPRPSKVKPPETPAAIAMRQLQGLPASSAAPLEVSQIVRAYLIATLGLPGRGITTEEIHKAVAEDPVVANEVNAFLSECDAAKFAPGSNAPTNLVEGARELIDKVERRARATATVIALSEKQP